MFSEQKRSNIILNNGGTCTGLECSLISILHRSYIWSSFKEIGTLMRPLWLNRNADVPSEIDSFDSLLNLPLSSILRTGNPSKPSK